MMVEGYPEPGAEGDHNFMTEDGAKVPHTEQLGELGDGWTYNGEGKIVNGEGKIVPTPDKVRKDYLGLRTPDRK